MTKTELRKNTLANRNALTLEQIQIWSADICNKLINSKEFQDANTIHVYKSFGSEVITKEIIQKAFEYNKTVVIPEIGQNRSLKHWQIFPNTVYKKDKFGIENPIKNYLIFETITLQPNDLILVPIVGFDCNNNRIGYGKGFYDKFLNKIKCSKLGIAFDCQKVQNFVPDPWDVKLDLIINN